MPSWRPPGDVAGPSGLFGYLGQGFPFCGREVLPGASCGALDLHQGHLVVQQLRADADQVSGAGDVPAAADGEPHPLHQLADPHITVVTTT
jgi:hypothetical protein